MDALKVFAASESKFPKFWRLEGFLTVRAINFDISSSFSAEGLGRSDVSMSSRFSSVTHGALLDQS